MILRSILLFLLLLIVVGWLFRFWLRRRFLRIRYKQSSKEIQSKMLQCYYCGLYIPQSEAIIVDNNIYCCLAHAQAKK